MNEWETATRDTDTHIPHGHTHTHMAHTDILYTIQSSLAITQL